ncbi:MAG: 2-amino-4-hydroxy-6-hydroxymethyldihydropteridine diphosphokinase [Candidatus Melainabacteria bacterium]|nr:2-amino-4-hydroxy-6-hydroxymethyldihydropteridine diphosphokinase [Candidatus Melainabacteria bacterium]
MHTAYLSLGSNLGNRQKNLETALSQIAECKGVKILKCSTWLENPAIEEAGPNPFLNGVIKISVNLSPIELLKELQRIELNIDCNRAERGRKSARIIDIDILLFDRLKLDSAELTIPHPRMLSRNFVLKPLDEIEPKIVQETVYSFFKLKPEYKIRRMMLSDLDEVCIIEADAYGEVHWTRDNFVSELDNTVGDYNVLYKDENEILGYLGSWMIIDEMHITTIATAKNHTRKGVAEALLIAQIFKALEQNIKALTLEVRVSNIKAQGLYEKYLFKRQGIRKRYYEDTLESALIMWTEDINSDEFQKNFRERLVELVNKSELFDK